MTIRRTVPYLFTVYGAEREHYHLEHEKVFSQERFEEMMAEAIAAAVAETNATLFVEARNRAVAILCERFGFTLREAPERVVGVGLRAGFAFDRLSDYLTGDPTEEAWLTRLRAALDKAQDTPVT